MEKMWFMIFNVVIAALVFGSIIYFVNSKSGPDDPDFYVRDLALTINEMSSKKGHVKVFYHMPQEYKVGLKDCNVILDYGLKFISKKYSYLCDPDIDIIITKEKNVLILEKEENGRLPINL